MKPSLRGCDLHASGPSVPKFDELTYAGGGATVYDAAIDDGSGGYGASVQNAAMINRARASASSSSSTSRKIPWPLNEGTFPGHTCVSGTPDARTIYAPGQVATA